MNERSGYPLIAVAGPTGSGKSALALQLALAFGGEIVNCDSVQVYAGLDIGSAKTTVVARAGVPHHLLDVVPASGEMTAGDYAREARVVLDQIRTRGALPIVTGGTGFYMRALLDGLSPAPTRNPALRKRLAALAEKRPAALHRFLRMRDKTAAERIHANDHQKLIRAIEMSGQVREEREGLKGYRVLKLGLAPERAELYQRLDQRCEWMFANGLLAETRRLLESGVDPTAKALGTLGYRQALGVVLQRVSVEEAVAECCLRTRHYAKRQVTWFRAEAGMRWLAGFGDEAGVQGEAAEMVADFTGRNGKGRIL